MTPTHGSRLSIRTTRESPLGHDVFGFLHCSLAAAMTGKRPTRKTGASAPPPSRQTPPQTATGQQSVAPASSSSRAVGQPPSQPIAAKRTAAQAAQGKATTAKAAAKKPAVRKQTPPRGGPAKVRLLSGGNPQIAKADGDAPVQAYIAALSGWKRELAAQLDQLITKVVPGVQKAVKWNSPFYGVEGEGWFLGVHTFTRYLKVCFFKGTSLQPLPPVASASGEARYLHLSDQEPFDASLLADWIRQAAAIPGWKMGG